MDRSQTRSREQRRSLWGVVYAEGQLSYPRRKPIAPKFLKIGTYPFILLNLAFSTQAAYAAPLILLAQTRQAERDKVHAEADIEHRDALAQEGLRREQQVERLQAELKTLLQSNTDLTEETGKLAAEVAELTRDIHGKVCA